MKTIQTPWGVSQYVEELGRGVLSVSTAGHGGIFVPTAELLKLPKCLQGFKTWTGSPNWFEEDCDAVVPVLMFPDLFEPKHVLYAINAVKSYRSADGGNYYVEHGFDFEAYILTDQGVRANQIAIESSNYAVETLPVS